MQKVSKAYRASMKSLLRERAYIMISFGLVNQEAQKSASIDQGDFSYFSNINNIFSDKTDDVVYATLEEGFTKVDGSMYFLPRQNDNTAYMDTGLVSKNIISHAQFEFSIKFNIYAIDFKGITIDFGENYPISFDIMTNNGQIIEFRNNSASIFSTEEVFENVTELSLIFYEMKNPQSRVRIYSIKFGYGLVYKNNDVMRSSLKTYVSTIAADLPTIDFEVELKNYNHYFDVDNPKSAINFLETGQQMEIYYGYQLPETDEIEWIKGNTLLCCDWESNDTSIIIRTQDILRTMDAEYYKGVYNSAGRSYYDLAVDVLIDAGITSFYIDPRLKQLITKNPIPRVKHKEALQIIANACRCILSQTRSGEILIKSSFIPEAEAKSETQAPYSNVAKILDGSKKDEYGTFATNYTVANGAMYFMPREVSHDQVINTGYISSEVSDANKQFGVNPTITIIREAACMHYGVKLWFGHAIPAEFIIRTYNNDEFVTELVVQEADIDKTTVIYDRFDDFDKMTIEFTKTSEPYSRIVLNNFSFGDITDFTMTRTDMISLPKAIRQEAIKEIVVPSYTFQPHDVEETIVDEEVTASINETETFLMDEPFYNISVKLNEAEANITIVEYGSYYVTIRYNISGTYKLKIMGYRYKRIERPVIKAINTRGKSVKWENPLISDVTMAKDLAEWLSDYYKSDVEYNYSTRGNPEIDVNDIIYQENEFVDNMKVNVYRQTLNFNQSFSGEIYARRVVE